MSGFVLAVDAMGGDDAPGMVIGGIAVAAERHPKARFLLVGDETLLKPLLAAEPRAAAVCTLRHAAETSRMAAPTRRASRMPSTWRWTWWCTASMTAFETGLSGLPAWSPRWTPRRRAQPLRRRIKARGIVPGPHSRRTL